MHRPAESAEALEETARASRGTEKRDALRKLAAVRLWSAEDADSEQDATRQRRALVRAVRDARGFNRSAAVGAELSFYELWSGWRAGRDSAERLAERYVESEREAGELLFFAWILRGEMALAREDFPQAAESFRFLLVHLDHPLYAFALWRTAHCYRGMGRDEDATQALRDVDALGQRSEASEFVRRIAAVARHELGPAPPPAANP